MHEFESGRFCSQIPGLGTEIAWGRDRLIREGWLQALIATGASA